MRSLARALSTNFSPRFSRDAIVAMHLHLRAHRLPGALSAAVATATHASPACATAACATAACATAACATAARASSALSSPPCAAALTTTALVAQ